MVQNKRDLWTLWNKSTKSSNFFYHFF